MEAWADFSRKVRRLSADFAAAQVRAALDRFPEEHKYDPNPAHQPKGAKLGGRSIGGQFAPKSAGAGAGMATQAASAAALDPEAVAAAGPGAAAAAAGGVAVSRQAGLYARYLDGQAITPILGLPGGKLETGPAPLTMSGGDGGVFSLRHYDDECEEQLEKDSVSCQLNAALYGQSKKQKSQIHAICMSSAMERYSECLVSGVHAVRTPLYSGRKIK